MGALGRIRSRRGPHQASPAPGRCSAGRGQRSDPGLANRYGRGILWGEGSREGCAINTLTPRKPRVLIVDDAPDLRLTLKGLAVKRGYEVTEAEDGAQGLEQARTRRPDLILLDIHMPNMNGLEALEEIREYDPSVSVVIISSSTDRDHLEHALALGAVNFVHKPFDNEEIEFVLDRIYRAVEEEADVRQVLDLVDMRSTQLSFPGSTAMLAKVVAYLGRELKNNYPGFELSVTEIKLALYEALANALEHGNLEISYEEKSGVMLEPGGIDGLIKSRLADPRYGERQIHIRVTYNSRSVTYRIRDEGPGFDPRAHAQRPLGDTSALHGRGLALIKHYMDGMEWNETGNEVLLTKKIHKPGENNQPLG